MSIIVRNLLQIQVKLTISNLQKSFISTTCSLLGRDPYSWRTHTCGELRTDHAGEKVTLCGWLRRNRGGKFLILTDTYGSVQLNLTNVASHPEWARLQNAPLESAICVEGLVQSRPSTDISTKLATGEIEVIPENVVFLNEAQSVPFEIRDEKRPNEAVRLRYRYLDLRFPSLQKNLKFRSDFCMKTRQFLAVNNFYEIETPTLFRRTPGGAREFLVPSHLKGKFYSLVQSPQQFKQLLMVGGMDRYFQIARCYRDESTLPQRQPEFTQVDIEMSFVGQRQVLDVIEDMMSFTLPISVRQSVHFPFVRLTYDEAMRTYGSDKPDLRFGWKIKDMSRHFSLKDGETVQCLVLGHVRQRMSNHEIQKITDQFDDITLVKMNTKGAFTSPVFKKWPPNSMQAFVDDLCVTEGDCLLVSIGEWRNACTVLGKARLAYVEALKEKAAHLYDDDAFCFAWIVDFPLFVINDDGKLESAHHPFTAPHPDDAELVYTEPLRCRSQHYDLVLNGEEIGGGSIRIHDSKLQRYILDDVLKEPSSQLEHLLEALSMGCPPHGGIALGLDRLVALLCGAANIRDVIAFPKSFGGKDLLSGAPCAPADAELKYYHIKVEEPQEETTKEG